jgi:uncharacterized membrane protein required for colicin V production
MNVVDLIALIVVASAAISGYRAGAVPQIFAWIGVASAVVAAFLALPLARSWLDTLDPFVRGIVVLGIFLAAFALGQGIGGVVGTSIRQRLGGGSSASSTRSRERSSVSPKGSSSCGSAAA